MSRISVHLYSLNTQEPVHQPGLFLEQEPVQFGLMMSDAQELNLGLLTVVVVVVLDHTTVVTMRMLVQGVFQSSVSAIILNIIPREYSCPKTIRHVCYSPETFPIFFVIIQTS